MKYSLLVLLSLCILQSNAQYFEQNEIFAGSILVHQFVGYSEFDVAPDGRQILRYFNDPCLPCDAEEIECILEADGTGSCYNMFFTYYRHSYFDKSGNIVQINENDSGYTLTTPSYQIPIPGRPYSVKSDLAGNIWLFKVVNSSNAAIFIYDSTGAMLNADTLPRWSFQVAGNGLLFSSQADTLRIYDSNFNLVRIIPLSGKLLDIAHTSDRYWLKNSTGIECFDTTGTALYNIQLQTFSNFSFEHQANDTLFIWSDNSLLKFHQDSLIWSVDVDAALTETIQSDSAGNIYYVANYAEPLYSDDDGSFIPTSYNVPPAIAFKGYQSDPDPFPGITSFIIKGKINAGELDSVVLSINNISASGEICTNNKFDALIGFNSLPFANANDEYVIELSDSTGSFSNAESIGQGKGLIIECLINNSVPPGSGYRIRARSSDSLLISEPFTIEYTVKTSPENHIFLDNSIYGNQACPPMSVVGIYDPAYIYEWFGVIDAHWDPTTFPLPGDSSVFTTSDYFEAIGLTVTDPSSGCSVTSSWIFDVTPIDSAFFTAPEIDLPDTVKSNDAPFEIFVYQGDTLTGAGIVPDDEPDYIYHFIPDSAGAGMHDIVLTIEHTGTPCVPYQFVKTIYVDSTLNNILTGDAPLEICQFDTFYVPFTLVDSLIYDSTTLFNVEKGYYDQDFNFITTEIVGSGMSSPVPCKVMNSDLWSMRFRVVADNGDKGSLNANGSVSLFLKPSLQLINGQSNYTCFKDTIMFSFSDADSASLYYHDTLISTQYGNTFIFDPEHEGTYTIALHGRCSINFDTITVDNSSSIPALNLITTTNMLCGKTKVLLEAATDSSSFLQWYHNDQILAGAINDSLFVNESGFYSVVATDSSGCVISATAGTFMFANPRITLNQDSISICPGEQIELSTHFDFDYSYQWIKNDTVLLATQYNQIIDDTGIYIVAVTGEMNCIDTSEAVVVTRHTLPLPSIHQGSVVNIQYGSTVTLSTDSIQDYNYQWFRNNNPLPAADQWFYIADKPGHYSVEVSIPQGCLAQSQTIHVKQRIRYQGPVHSTERAWQTGSETFVVYPNPSAGSFTIRGVVSEKQKINIVVYDLFGRTVFVDAVTKEGAFEAFLDLGSVAEGLYTISLSADDEMRNIPVLIAR